MMSALSRRCAAHVLRTLRCYLLKALTSSRYTAQKRLNIPNDKLIIMESVYKYSILSLIQYFYVRDVHGCTNVDNVHG